MADGSVEIKITGSVDPSVVASANQTKAAMAGIGDATTVSAKAMAAALTAAGGNIKKITPEMLGLAAATTASAAATSEQTAATVVNTVATEANAHAAINSRSVYEGLALVHEAMAGRYTRMASTSLIFGQALAGQSAVTSAIAFATSAYGLAILGTVAAIGLATAATISYESEEKKLTATAVGLGAQSGLTAAELKKIGESANSSSQSIRETTKAAEAFAAAGITDAQSVKTLSNSVEAYSQLIGVKFAQAQKTLAEAMKDPVKGAKELHEQLGILDGDQLQQIETLTALGRKDEAVAIITQALKERIDEAKQAGVGLRGEFGSLIDVLSNVYEKIGQVTEGFGAEAETLLEKLIPALHQAGQAHRDAAAGAAQQAQNEAALAKISGRGKDAYDATPEGRAAKERADLQGNLSAARDALKVDQALVAQGKEKADVLVRDRQAIADYTHATTTYLTEVQKKTKVDALDVQIAAAKHAHNKQLVADLTQQKALLQEAGKIESDADARALAKGKGDVAGARTFAPKGGKGPSVVSEWTEQLHAAEVASNNFFADQTEAELKFWESKVGLVKHGSKEWLDVQSKIYAAQKTLARRNYDEHIADLNDRIEADHDDFKKFQADWAEKLAFIRSKFGEESTEYKNAHRQMEAEERHHQEQMIREELSGQSKSIQALKAHLQAQLQLRQEYARTTEAVIRANAENSPFGDVTAAARIGQLHHQLALEEVADAEAAYNAENALREKGLTDALQTYGADDQRYRQALNDKKAADQQYHDQRAQLEAKAYAQQIQDILSLKAAYHSYIDGIAGSTVSGLTSVLDRTQTWKQAVIGIYNSIKSAVDQALTKMVSNWVVEHVFMTSAQRAQLAIQNAQHTASEATKTAVTTTGVASRTGVESTGFFAKMLSLLGIHLGAHTATEGAKTAATTTGATARAAVETTTAATSAASQIAANVTTALSYVGVAGAAGTASWAGAPWPIDAGAPAFGASMAAAAGGYTSLASLDVGTNYLPRDQVVQAHEGERIIPKADNRKLMEVLQLATNDNGPAGDLHFHSSPTFNGNIASWQDMVDKHERDMIRWFKRQWVNGPLRPQRA